MRKSIELLDRLFGGMSDYAERCGESLTDDEKKWFDIIRTDLEEYDEVEKAIIELKPIVEALKNRLKGE